jgi:cystathionine beta-synthase
MAERNFLDVEKEQAAKNWWYDLPVSRLALRAPVTVGLKVRCQDAIDIMNRESFDQLPVIDDSGFAIFLIAKTSVYSQNF